MKSLPLQHLLLGSPSDSVCIFIHGKFGCKEEAQYYPELQNGSQVLAVDLPNKGDVVPWEIVPVLQEIIEIVRENWQHVSLFALSIGAWFSLQAFSDAKFEHCYFVSPVTDMRAMIEGMMKDADVNPERLESEGTVGALSFEYYQYVLQHPILSWTSPTSILYGRHDVLVRRESVTAFAEKFGCCLTIFEEGEHWFHTDDQMKALHEWLEKEG